MAKHWTKLETEYLQNNLGNVKLNTIAKNLGKTKLAVTLKKID